MKLVLKNVGSFLCCSTRSSEIAAETSKGSKQTVKSEAQFLSTSTTLCSFSRFLSSPETLWAPRLPLLLFLPSGEGHPGENDQVFFTANSSMKLILVFWLHHVVLSCFSPQVLLDFRSSTFRLSCLEGY